jgi:predicted nucleic acid-binding protein
VAAVICLDASVLIALFSKHDLHHDEAVRLVSTHGHQGLIISPITLAEVLLGPVRQGKERAARAAISQLGITVTPIAADFAESLARIRVDSKLPLPQCCVLLAAADAKAELLSFDRQLRTVAGQRGVSVID